MNASPVGIAPAILLLSASGCWGIATVLSKSLLQTVSPVPLLFIQLLASCLFLVPLCIALGRKLQLGWSLLPAALLGVMNPGISYTFSMMALERIPAGVASIFWATEPFLILLLAAIVLKERITLALSMVIALGFSGAALVSGLLSTGVDQFGDAIGSTYMAIAVLLCAVYTVVSRRMSNELDPLVLVAVQQVAGLAWASLLTGLISSHGQEPVFANVSIREIGYAAMTGILYYAFAYWLYLSALSRVSAALAGASFNIIPVVAIGLAFVLLDERLDTGQTIGVVLITVSGFLLVLMTSRHDVSAASVEESRDGLLP